MKDFVGLSGVRGAQRDERHGGGHPVRPLYARLRVLVQGLVVFKQPVPLVQAGLWQDWRWELRQKLRADEF